MSFNPLKYLVAVEVGEDSDPAKTLVVAGLRYSFVEPDSYFVLRNRDILGASSLWAYVQNARTLIDLNDTLGTRTSFLGGRQRQHLIDLADSAAGMATQWDTLIKKIPD